MPKSRVAVLLAAPPAQIETVKCEISPWGKVWTRIVGSRTNVRRGSGSWHGSGANAWGRKPSSVRPRPATVRYRLWPAPPTRTAPGRRSYR